ncbi:MAG: hypothetical protein LBS01_08050 [Prevotellaceae bacterium]|jgi:hypothetical protein|nr:hypothetical protein [Prevotellaceae bacterium]
MNKSILILGFLALMSGGQSLSAQVGINTDTPKTTLDIVQKDTATVKGRGFRLVDGNERETFALVCDADGVGTWKQITTPVIFGNIVNKTINFPFKKIGASSIPPSSLGMTEADSLFLNTGAYIELPPGMWRVDVICLLEGMPAESMIINDYKMWFRGTFGDNAESRHISPDVGIPSMAGYKLISGIKEPNDRYNFVSGSVIIRNTGMTIKRYYFILGAVDLRKGGLDATITSDAIFATYKSSFSENSITAIPIHMPDGILY